MPRRDTDPHLPGFQPQPLCWACRPQNLPPLVNLSVALGLHCRLLTYLHRLPAAREKG